MKTPNNTSTGDKYAIPCRKRKSSRRVLLIRTTCCRGTIIPPFPRRPNGARERTKQGQTKTTGDQCTCESPNGPSPHLPPTPILVYGTFGSIIRRGWEYASTLFATKFHDYSMMIGSCRPLSEVISRTPWATQRNATHAALFYRRALNDIPRN